MNDKIDAYLALRSGGRLLIGRERIRLLEAVAAHGSITRAAKATGTSYKTVWEAVDAINNLLPTPAFITKAGGNVGGGAEVTPEGQRLISTFHRLEERLTKLSSMIAAEGIDGLEDALMWTIGLKISARNVFQTEVVQVRRWPVDVEVTLKVSSEHTIRAVVTNQAADELNLVPGRRVLALIKAPFIRIGAADADTGTGKPMRNRFVGTVKRRTDAELNSEIHLDIGDAKTMIAVVPRQEIEDLAIEVGDRAAATFDADHVILATD